MNQKKKWLGSHTNFKDTHLIVYRYYEATTIQFNLIFLYKDNTVLLTEKLKCMIIAVNCMIFGCRLIIFGETCDSWGNWSIYKILM